MHQHRAPSRGIQRAVKPAATVKPLWPREWPSRGLHNPAVQTPFTIRRSGGVLHRRRPHDALKVIRNESVVFADNRADRLRPFTRQDERNGIVAWKSCRRQTCKRLPTAPLSLSHRD